MYRAEMLLSSSSPRELARAAQRLRAVRAACAAASPTTTIACRASARSGMASAACRPRFTSSSMVRLPTGEAARLSMKRDHLRKLALGGAQRQDLERGQAGVAIAVGDHADAHRGHEAFQDPHHAPEGGRDLAQDRTHARGGVDREDQVELVDDRGLDVAAAFDLRVARLGARSIRAAVSASMLAAAPARRRASASSAAASPASRVASLGDGAHPAHGLGFGDPYRLELGVGVVHSPVVGHQEDHEQDEDARRHRQHVESRHREDRQLAARRLHLADCRPDRARAGSARPVRA